MVLIVLHWCTYESRPNLYLFLISCCFTSTNFGSKVRIFLIIKRLKVLFRVDISKILVHAVIPHDSVYFWHWYLWPFSGQDPSVWHWHSEQTFKRWIKSMVREVPSKSPLYEIADLFPFSKSIQEVINVGLSVWKREPPLFLTT